MWDNSHLQISPNSKEKEERANSTLSRTLWFSFFQIVKICEQLEDAGNIERLAA